MYNSLFGSIFSAEEGRPQPKKAAKPISAKEIVPKAEPAKKGPVSGYHYKITPITTSDNPLVQVEEASLALQKAKQINRVVKRRLRDLATKYKSAQIYKEALILFRQLSPEDKAQLEKWFISHLTAIKHLGSARELAKITADTEEAVKSLDSEIKHRENILKLKKAGAHFNWDIREVSPGQPIYEGLLPQIYAEGAKNLKINYTLAGDQATDLAVKSMAYSEKAQKEATTKKTQQVILDKLMAKLPGPHDSRDKREIAKFPRRLKKRAENLRIKVKDIEWKTKPLISEFIALQKKYDDHQDELTALIELTGKSPAANAIAILVEARPEKFLSSPNLLEACKNAFKRLSQFGDDEVPDKPLTPEEEAKKLLVEQSDKSIAVLKELETRQNVLAKIEAELKGKPAPAPIQIFVLPPPPPPPPKKAVVIAAKANKILPWIAGLLLFFKLLES